MSKLIVTDWTTLDGYIAGPGGEMDWIMGDDEMAGYELGVAETAGAMLFGGKTYREFSQYWPNVPKNPDAAPFEQAFAAKINPLPKVVVSRSLEEPLWENTTIWNSLEPESVRKLKAETSGNILLYGSASLVHQLTDLGLVDEYHLLVHPLLLGNGLSLLGTRENRVKLECVKAQPFKSGVLQVIYQPGQG
jgi:dihydrofolate reductase